MRCSVRGQRCASSAWLLQLLLALWILLLDLVSLQLHGILRDNTLYTLPSQGAWPPFCHHRPCLVSRVAPPSLKPLSMCWDLPLLQPQLRRVARWSWPYHAAITVWPATRAPRYNALQATR